MAQVFPSTFAGFGQLGMAAVGKAGGVRFPRPTAVVAGERLRILLSHERALVGGKDLLGILREDILAVVSKYVSVEREQVQVRMERNGSVSTLGVDIDIPGFARLGKA